MDVLLTMPGLLGFAWLGVFQLLLAAGAPLGRLAWGGQHRVLPARLRWASLLSAAIAVLGGVALGQAAGLLAGPIPPGLLRPMLWGLFALFVLSMLGNALSQSRIERVHGVTLAAILATSLFLAATL